MLGGVKASGGADWSVLIMDAVTTKVMSKAARISEILDYGVSRAPHGTCRPLMHTDSTQHAPCPGSLQRALTASVQLLSEEGCRRLA